MILLLSATLAVSFLFCYAVTSLYDYHMFQLNSYNTKTQLKWLLRNFLKGYLYRHIFAVPIIAAVFMSPPVAALLPVPLFLIQLYLNRPRKAKKPLVYTMRVKRMLITNAVVIAAVTAYSFSFASYFDQIIFLATAMLLTPVLALLSNLINMPMEKAINRWYINDAKRIIREMPGLTVIGITGSYGKTSTKYFLYKLLSSKFNVLMTPESFNTTLGVVKTVRTSLKPVHEIFICEMGAKGVGEIKEICDIVNPKYGIITSIGPQHLETFKSQENIIKTKFELADAVPEDGAVFLNYGNAYIRNNPCDKKVISYSISDENCDYTAGEIKATNSGLSFSVELADGNTRSFETKLIGAHNAENLLGCIAVADYLGVGPDDIAISVRRLESVPHRLQLINRGGTLIIDDAYNSNQSGAKAALDALGMFDGFKILVTPGMIELGGSQDEYNFQFGVQATEVCDYVILVGERQTKSILGGLRSVGYGDGKIFIAEDLGQVFKRIDSIDAGGAQKVVLLENDLPDNY